MIDRSREDMTFLSRRALLRGAACLGLAASAVTAQAHFAVLAQDATPAGTTGAPEFRLVARVLAGDWPALATATATPVAGEELTGPALLATLREGGFVIYFRHARTDFSQDD